jgi:hypothetical protein
MSARRHELRQEHPIQITEFWAFGFLSVVLAVLKVTVAGHWSLVESDVARIGLSRRQPGL